MWIASWVGKILLLALATLVVGCAPEQPEEAEVPLAPVSLQVDLDGDGFALREPLSFLLFTTPRGYEERLGHAGILLVHGWGAVAQGGGREHAYYAYDRLCPVEWPERVAIDVGAEGWLLAAQCPRCGTVYDLSVGTGHVVSGVGRVPLTRYQVFEVGNVLRIKN